MEIALAVLLVLAFPIIAIAGLVIAIGARDRVRNLEQRFADIQKSRPVAAVAAPQSQAPAAPDFVTPAAQTGAHIPGRAGSGRDPRGPRSYTETGGRRVGAALTASSAAAPAEPAMGFEERFGTQWTVWVGGIALAFGGFFLVRYSIEQGWFGPGMRVFLGALLALALIAAGEWARRKENLSGIGGVPAAHIPSILTAAGTAVAYADIYAAFALYNFIAPGTAFILLGIVALGTLAAALVHGPALAGLGLVGAYVTPLIISTDKPNFWALYLYLAVVTAAAFMLARARMWRWLAITAIAFGLFWTLPGLALLKDIGIASHAFHVIAGFALVAVFIVSGFLFGPDAAPGKVDAVSSLGLAAYLFGALLIVLMSRHDTIALITFVALTVAVVAIAWRSEAAAAAVPLAGVMVALMFLQFSVGFAVEQLVLPSGPTAGAVPEPQHVFYGTASRARRRPRLAVRRRRLPRPGPLDTADGADAVGGCRGVRAARDPGRAVLSHLQIRAGAAVRRHRAGSRRAVHARHRNAEPPRVASRQRRGRRDLRDRRGRGLGARADHGAGKRLAHRRACADGAGRRLGRRQASAAGAAHPGRRAGRGRAGAHRLQSGHRRADQPRHHTDLQLAAVGLRHPGRRHSGSAAICCGGAPTTRRRGWRIRPRCCSACCSPCFRCATT